MHGCPHRRRRSGNITHKQVTGSSDPAANYNLNYQYPANGARLTSISGDLAATLVYDANGSITGGLYTVTWTAFNTPASISKPGQGTSTFKYGPDRQRYRHDYTENGSTITRHLVGQLFEAVHKATVEEYHHHVMAYEVVATHIRRSNGVHGTVWPLKDHLGSVDVVLDEAQQEVGHTSFDAFGRRRSALTWDGLPETGTIVGGAREFTNRGYTGHEMLDSVDLVHMNGRVYDPLIGRFLSIDPIIGAPGTTQGWNRYGYVYNNPLAFTDPSGFDCHDNPNPQRRCHQIIDGRPVPDLYKIKPGENLTKEDDACLNNREWCQQVRANMGPYGGPQTFEYADPPPPPPNGPVVSLHDSAPAYFSAQFDDKLLPAPTSVVIGGIIALSFAPGTAETADAFVLGDPNSTRGERALAFGSSFLNASTGGFGPNAGPIILASRRIVNLPFRNGDVVLREFQTSQGILDVAAEAQIVGRTLHLKDIAVFPRGTEALALGAQEIRALRNQLAAEARALGFDKLRITGTRITGANPGKATDVVIDLTK